jgi:uncharacterized repeat protein (TIGR01451 family)
MRKNKKLLLIVIVAILAVSIPVTIVLLHQGQEPSDGGPAEVPSDTPTDEPEVPPTTPSTTLAILSAATGNVSVMNSGTDSWTGAQVEMSLETGDSVKTGDSSSADITFLDGSTIQLEANTEIEIVSLEISTDTGSKTIRLKQVIGDTMSRVEKLVDTASSYEIETPACVAAVRGSVMLVNVIEDGTTWVTNQEGDIWVIVDGVELQVPEGRKCIILFGQLPQLVPLTGGGGGGGGFSPNPDITITKMPDLIQAHEGDTITYTYTVTNPGNIPLSNVSVTDNRSADITYQNGDTDSDGRLDTNETWIFTANYTIPTGGADHLVNPASAQGSYAGVGTIIDWTTASVDILRPDIALNKTAQPTEAYIGDTITYTYTITNPGNTPLYDVLVTDDMIEDEDIDYQSGDTNGDDILDVDETWVLTATYTITADDDSPLFNTATASGTDALSLTVESEDSASVEILQPGVLGTVYIGYEDQEGGDFDYNDFGMKMSIEETYVDGCLTEIDMVFESVVDIVGGSCDIHIRRQLAGSTSYNYIITRSTPGPWPVIPVVPPLGWGSFDIMLFDTSYVWSGAKVTIHIEITGGCEPYNPAPVPPRDDLDPIWAYYDPYINNRTTETERHIEDCQPAVEPLPIEGYEAYDVPYILVVPVTDWEAPAEGQCITDLYLYFDDYYATGSPDNWYEIKAS